MKYPIPSNLAYRSARAKDLAFHLIRDIRPEHDVLRNWTAYNRSTHARTDEEAHQQPADIIAPLTILPFKADAHETMNTVGERSKVVVNHIGRKYVFLTSDQAVNAPAHETKWTRGNNLFYLI